MELKDFVAVALREIVEGVAEAQTAVAPSGAKINPKLHRVIPKGEKNYELFAWADGEGANPVFLVNFDVAVTAARGAKTKGGVGVVAGVVSLGSSGASEKSESSVSRLSFRIPLLLPLHR